MADDRPDWPFASIPFEVWRQAAERDLGGRSWDDLRGSTEDGVGILPLYTPDVPGRQPLPGEFPGVPPFHRHARAAGSRAGRIEIRMDVDDPDPERARGTASLLLRHGASALGLVFAGADPDGRGLPEGSADVLRTVLADVDPATVRLALDAGTETPAVARALVALVTARGVPVERFAPRFGFDPLAARVRAAAGPGDPGAGLDGLVEFVDWSGAHVPAAVPLAVDARVWAEAGAGPALELGLALATGASFLRTLLEAGRDPAAAARGIEFRFGLGREPFVEIARLRAARLCWARIAEQAGLDGRQRAARIHAAGLPALRTRHDPWVNLLRGTVETFAAIVGGAESVSTLPFDLRCGVPDVLGRRLAAHTPAILTLEGHLDRVIDPAGGSHFVENLTLEIASSAWKTLQQIERVGGMSRALAEGLVARLVSGVRAERDRRIRTRTAPITGVSTTPIAGEPPLDRAPWPAGVAGPKDGPLDRHPWAAPFEALRDRAEAHARRTGARPRIFLALLGPAAGHRAQALWARHLAVAGGLDPVEADGGGDRHALAEAFSRAGTGAAILCGDDGHAAAAVEALRARGARLVLQVAAGAGTTPVEGADGLLPRDVDAVATVERIFEALGVA